MEFNATVAKQKAEEVNVLLRKQVRVKGLWKKAVNKINREIEVSASRGLNTMSILASYPRRYGEVENNEYSLCIVEYYRQLGYTIAMDQLSHEVYLSFRW